MFVLDIANLAHMMFYDQNWNWVKCVQFYCSLFLVNFPHPGNCYQVPVGDWYC